MAAGRAGQVWPQAGASETRHQAGVPHPGKAASLGQVPPPSSDTPHDQHTCLDLPSGELPGGSRTAHGTSTLVIPQGWAPLPWQGGLTAELSSGLGVFAQGRHTHPTGGNSSEPKNHTHLLQPSTCGLTLWLGAPAWGRSPTGLGHRRAGAHTARAGGHS